jgi:hypothetical protein
MSTYKTDSAGNVGQNDLASVQDITATSTLTYEQSGGTFLVGTDALVINLPATKKGVEYTFINTGAAGNNIIEVNPVDADGICGTITLASSVVTRVGTVGAALINTKATSTLGNAVTIVGTGLTGTKAWIIKSSTGIWA